MLLALGVVAVGVAAPASAHQNTITAAVTCTTDHKWRVTWSVANSESDKTEQITESSDTTLVPIDTKLLAGETKKFTETVATPAPKLLTLDATWSNGVPRQNTGSITAAQFTPACVAPTSTGLYLYKKLDATKDAAWPNSGLQTKIATWSGWSYKGQGEYPAVLPSDVCGPGWGVQQDQINGPNSLFPDTIKYPERGGFASGVLHAARHDNLSSLVTVPDCGLQTKADVTPQTCVANGQISVLVNSHIVYKIDGVVVRAASTTVTPGTHTVTATIADPNGPYALDGQASWTLDSTAFTGECGLPPHSLVTPTASSTAIRCDAPGSYILGAVEGVVWTVDGKVTSAGTYSVASAATVKAVATTASSDYGFAQDTQTSWPFVFTEPTDCPKLATLAFTGSNGTLAGGLLLGLIFVLFGAGVITVSRLRSRNS